MHSRHDSDRASRKIIVLAGLCGGVAEVAWVTLYAALAGISGIEVARQVTASVLPANAGAAAAPLIGLLIHMALSIGLGAAFAWATWRFLLPRLGPAAIMPVAVVTLALVWATNFLVVLPVINPAFVTLMPYGATLFSKMLFGLAMAEVLREAPARSRRAL